MKATRTYPDYYCFTGRHFFPNAFASCPIHRTKRFNVRVRMKFPTIKKPDGSMTNEWTFQQQAETAKLAARRVLDAMFGDRQVAGFYVADVEVWEAEREGIYGPALWKGTAS